MKNKNKEDEIKKNIPSKIYQREEMLETNVRLRKINRGLNWVLKLFKKIYLFFKFFEK